MLQDCFDVTDWSVFVHDDIDTFTDTVMSYIHFCESVCIPIKTVISYSNNKPWLNKDVRRLCREKNAVMNSDVMIKHYTDSSNTNSKRLLKQLKPHTE